MERDEIYRVTMMILENDDKNSETSKQSENEEQKFNEFNFGHTKEFSFVFKFSFLEFRKLEDEEILCNKIETLYFSFQAI